MDEIIHINSNPQTNVNEINPDMNIESKKILIKSRKGKSKSAFSKSKQALLRSIEQGNEINDILKEQQILEERFDKLNENLNELTESLYREK